MRLVVLFISFFCFSPLLSQHFEWVEQAGLNGGGNDYTLDAIEDSHGNIYTSGMAKNNVTVGVGVNQMTLAGFGDQDLLILKYKSDGVLKWARRFGSGLTEQGAAIEMDTSDNIYVSGLFQTSFSIGTYNLTAVGSNNGYLAKFDSSGQVQWAIDWGGINSSTIVHDLVVLDNGDCFILGSFTDSTIIGNDTLYSVGGSDVYLAKMSTSGQYIWARRYGGTQLDDGSRLKINSTGELIGSGRHTSTANFNGNQVQGIGLEAWVARFDTSGNVNWISSIGGPQGDRGGGLAIGQNGEYYLCGNFRDTAFISTDSTDYLVSSGSADVFLVKFDSVGQLLWQRTFGGPLSTDRGYDVLISENDKIWLNFSIDNNSDFNSSLLNIVGNDDDIIFEINQDGTDNWMLQIPGFAASGIKPFVSRLNKFSCNRLLISGAFLNTVPFVPFTKTAHTSAADGFVGVLRPRISSVSLDSTLCLNEVLSFTFNDSCSIDSISLQITGIDTIINNGFSQSILFNSAGWYSAQVVIDDGYYSDTLMLDSALHVFGLPNPSLDDSISFCEEATVQLYPGSFFSYLWSDSSIDTSLLVSSSGQYWVNVEDGNGCSVVDSTIVFELPKPVVDLGPDSTICPNDSVQLSVDSFETINWSTGDSTQSIYTSIPSPIFVFVEDSLGCQNRDTINVFNHTVMSPNLGVDTVICVYDSINLFGGNFASYLWSTGSSANNIWVGDSGLVSIIVIDTNSCSSYDEILVEFDPCIGISELSKSPLLSLFPNPSSNEITIQLNGTEDEIDVIYIYSIDGKLVKKQSEGKNVLKVFDLKNGIYQVRIETLNNRIYFSQFVKF